MAAQSRIAVALAGLGVAFVPASALADETLLCDKYINAVPYTITKPGHYCLRSNLVTTMTQGTAITIDSDSVWLDLNNFILDGSAAGKGTIVTGIFSANRRDIAVRNGVVRGFMFGIELATAATGRNYDVEKIRAEGNTVAGILIHGGGVPGGGGHTVRDNVVIDTGGSTEPGAFAAFAIVLGGGGHLSGNEVVDVTASAPSLAIGFDLREGTVIASDNRVSGAGVGFSCDFAEKYLRDNTAVVSAVAYTPLCTKIGINNFP
jgi:hypothetical protein